MSTTEDAAVAATEVTQDEDEKVEETSTTTVAAAAAEGGEEGETKVVKEAKDKLSGLNQKGSTFTLLADLNAELDVKQQELLRRVRRSVHVARGNSPGLRFRSEIVEGGRHAGWAANGRGSGAGIKRGQCIPGVGR